MDDTRTRVDSRQVEVINTGEELLVRARALARQIDERVGRAMDEHGLPPLQGQWVKHKRATADQ